MTFDSFVGKCIFVQSRNRGVYPRGSLVPDMGYLSRSSSSSSTLSTGSGSTLAVIEESLSEEEYEHEHDGCTSGSDSDKSTTDSLAGEFKSEFRLLLTSRNCQLLTFYRSVLAPYTESYWLTVNRLSDFMESQASAESNSPVIVQEAVFLKDLTAHAQEMLLKGQINYGTFA